MELTLTSITTVLQLLVMGAVGFLAYKIGFIKDREVDGLGVILKELMITVMLISIAFKPYSSDMVSGLIISFFLAIFGQGMGYLIAVLVIKKTGNKNCSVERMACCGSNVGFIGTAIVSIMLGDVGLIYLSSSIIVCNMFIFGPGEWTAAGKFNAKSVLKYIKSPIFICLVSGVALYFLQLPIPKWVSSPLTTIGNMTGPLAMILSGATLAKANLKELFQKKNTYLVMLIKSFISPLSLIPVILLLNHFFVIDSMAMLTAYIACACPIPTMVIVLAMQHGHDGAYASGLASLSMVVTMFAIPIDMAIYSAIVL